jgi:hypothetical protein
MLLQGTNTIGNAFLQPVSFYLLSHLPSQLADQDRLPTAGHCILASSTTDEADIQGDNSSNDAIIQHRLTEIVEQEMPPSTITATLVCSSSYPGYHIPPWPTTHSSF